MSNEEQQQPPSPPKPLVVSLLEDAEVVGWVAAGFCGFTGISAIGEAVPSLSQGVLVWHTCLHALIALIAFLVSGLAIAKADGQQSVWQCIAPVVIYSMGALIVLWFVCGLGAWVGG